MKFIIAADFLADFELIEAPDRLSAEAYIIDSLNHNDPGDDIKVLANSDSMTAAEVLELTNEIIYISDFE